VIKHPVIALIIFSAAAVLAAWLAKSGGLW
jgi:hypothetical protein